ncbi:hypothetical protein [Cecembia lonarensis]|uniref:Uncharacterized protein n=1 Tax=Cecembia lonarensis (strain CCUG 58316 / KCTC 22772 / LW9) TaxID=1225176 RepID=K1LBF6_CECL9|nr:hypothetical protein [Cecembia lonarensis]EKB49592.1 hypothetical protein B879_01796 [Cecembia lonarensis LW9]
MIFLTIDKETLVFKGFDRYSKFILIGNSESGYINIKTKEYSCFEEVIQSLPRIINDLAFFGNWDLCLYQIPKTYKLIEKPRNYLKPDRGKMIFKIDSNIATSLMDIFVNFSMIHFAFYEKKVNSKKDQHSIEYNIHLSERYVNILLEENSKNFKISLNKYHGNTDKLFDSQRY